MVYAWWKSSCIYWIASHVTQNEAALAIVLGHEITHAVAHHGQERMSQALVAQGVSVVGDVFTSGNQQCK